MPLVLAFLSPKVGRKKNQKNETSTSQNWVGVNEISWMPSLKTRKMTTSLDCVGKIYGISELLTFSHVKKSENKRILAGWEADPGFEESYTSYVPPQGNV